jgi:hypothetical protein
MPNLSPDRHRKPKPSLARRADGSLPPAAIAGIAVAAMLVVGLLLLRGASFFLGLKNGTATAMAVEKCDPDGLKAAVAAQDLTTADNAYTVCVADPAVPAAERAELRALIDDRSRRSADALAAVRGLLAQKKCEAAEATPDAAALSAEILACYATRNTTWRAEASASEAALDRALRSGGYSVRMDVVSSTDKLIVWDVVVVASTEIWAKAADDPENLVLPILLAVGAETAHTHFHTRQLCLEADGMQFSCTPTADIRDQMPASMKSSIRRQLHGR